MNAPLLVIGVGNSLRGDDGVGLYVAELLCNDPAFRTVQSDGDLTNLLDTWRDAKRAVLIDAVVTGAASGTVHSFDVSDQPLLATSFPASSHAFGLADAIEMSRALGTLPAQLLVIGIEVTQTEHGESLSASVVGAAAEVVALLRTMTEREPEPAHA